MKAFGPFGYEIVGIEEEMKRCLADVEISLAVGGGIQVEYTGGTAINWDDQAPMLTPEGERIFRDEGGHTVYESEIIFADAVTTPEELAAAEERMTRRLRSVWPELLDRYAVRAVVSRKDPLIPHFLIYEPVVVGRVVEVKEAG